MHDNESWLGKDSILVLICKALLMVSCKTPGQVRCPE